MSERHVGFIEDCVNEAKEILECGVEGAKVGYKVAEPYGLGPVGGAVGFVAGVKHADKIHAHRAAREFGERISGADRSDD